MSHVRLGKVAGMAALALSACAPRSPSEPSVHQPQVSVVVDAGERHQTIEGFGTAINTWSPQMRDFYRRGDFQRSYVEELGFNVVRINLWGPTLPRKVEDWRDISHRGFDRSIARFEIYFDFIRGLQRVDPNLKLIATVWSPPAWMKENNSIVDRASGALDGPDQYLIKGQPVTNRVLPEYFPHFVKWMTEMAKLFSTEGMPLYAISPANEPMFTQTFESALWTAQDLATVVGMLGARLEAEGQGGVKIYAPETMTGGWWTTSNRVYVAALTANPSSRKHLGAFATHGYTDGFKSDLGENTSSQFWDVVREHGRPFWLTEGGTGEHQWPAPLTGVAAAAHNAFVHGNASMFVPWQVSEPEATEHNLMIMDMMTHKTDALRHYSRFVRPGAIRVSATPAEGDVSTSAFYHPTSNALTVVIINPSSQERRVRLTVRNAELSSRMRVYRTSLTERMAHVGTVAVAGGESSITLPPQTIVTVSGARE